MKSENLDRAWLDDEGHNKPDAEIKTIYSNWSARKWDEHLSRIEGKQTELLLDDPSMIDNISQEDYEQGFLAISDCLNENTFQNLQETFLKILEEMTENQRQVLDYIFWKNLNLCEISRLLGVSRTAVQGTRDRALKRFGKVLLQLVSKERQSEKINNDIA